MTMTSAVGSESDGATSGFKFVDQLRLLTGMSLRDAGVA